MNLRATNRLSYMNYNEKFSINDFKAALLSLVMCVYKINYDRKELANN